MRPRLRTPELLIGAVFAAIVVGYASVMVFALDGPLGPRVGYGTDSQIYMDAARHPVWTLDFLAARPWLFLLLAKLCARNLRAIALVQSVIYVGAWIFLAATARSIVRTRGVQLGLYCALLLMALAPSMLQWNVIISTESLSMSVTCVVVACALRLALTPSTATLVAFVAGLGAFVFVRDTNALAALGLAGAAVVVAVAGADWRRVGAVIAVAAVGFASVALVLSNQSEPPRWYYPLHETIALRLVGDDTAEPYFVDRGLPLDEHLLALRETYFVTVTRLDDGEEFEPLRTWVREEGRSTYTSFLVRHSWWTLRHPFADRGRLLSPDLNGYTEIWDLDPPVFYRVSGLAYPGSAPLVAVWSVAAFAGLVVVAVRRLVRASVLLVVFGLGGLAVAGFYAAWHGDALEVDRHSLTAALQLRLAVWFATASVVDAVLSSRRSGVEHAHEPDLEDGEERGETGDYERPEPIGG